MGGLSVGYDGVDALFVQLINTAPHKLLSSRYFKASTKNDTKPATDRRQ